jgi:CheY-like chemotaxis protein
MSEPKKCRVLFVEDEAAISMLIEDMLLDLGVEIVGPASKLSRALELARSAEIEAAVLDINIGGMVSYPVADLLLERRIPVIFATGYDSSVLPERFKDCWTIHKPFDQPTFASVLQSALSTSPCDLTVA